MSEIRVRRADPAEFAAIGALTVEVYRLLRDGVPGEYDALLADVARRAADGEVYVAVDDAGTLVGSVTFATHGSEYAEQSAPDEGVFRMLAVSTSARGRGAGRELVQACIDRARALRLRRLRLSTQPSMVEAHRLYERMGFLRTPEDDWSPRPGVDLITYALTL